MDLDISDKVLLFISEELEQARVGALELAPLSEKAAVRGVCFTSKGFKSQVKELRRDGLVDTKGVESKTQMVLLELAGYERVVHLRRALQSQEAFPAEPATAGDFTPPTEAVALPKAGLYSEDLDGVLLLYKERLSPEPSENDLERLQYWYESLQAQGRPAFKWMQEAICRTSTKVRAEQRTLAYMLGILKSWGEFGYKSDLGTETRKLHRVFERRFDCSLSDPARQKLVGLIDQHGLVDTLEALFSADDLESDPSMRFVLLLEKSLNKGD